MRVLKKEPGKRAEITEIDNTLEALQGAVGGYIETVTFTSDVVVICNEEGRIHGLQENCEILGVSFVGTILFVGKRGEDFCSLRPETEKLIRELVLKEVKG